MFQTDILKSLLIVPKLPYITVLSIGFSQLFVPSICRLLFDFKTKKDESKKCQLFMEGTCGVCVRIFVLIIFLTHFAVMGYNLYVQGLDPLWIGLLLAYIIWSSFKYVANYINDDSKILPILSWIKKKKDENYEDFNFETQYMRAWICSVFQIISKNSYR